MSSRRLQVLFVHPNFPAQFGPIARRLATRDDVECVFVSNAEGMRDGIRCIRFELRGGATKASHYCSRTFENAVWHAHAIFEACKGAEDLKPDLVVGHSGFGTTAFLGELYESPVLNLFEYYYHGHDSDMDFRPEFPPTELDYLRSRMRNAMILTDLVSCTRGYTPTEWQRSRFPGEFLPKLDVVHDGIDVDFWRRREAPRSFGEMEPIPPDAPLVTYVARGLEAMRGFDVFVRVAKRILATLPDAHFVVVGGDRTHYGNDNRFIAARSFREHVLDMELPDLRRFRFLGRVSPERLVEVFSMSDLHVYLTVPFVLSWSLLNAMSCECPILASDTAPVKEVVTHGETGLLSGFNDVEAFTESALEVLREPARFREMARNGRQLVEERYGMEVVYPRMIELYSRTLGREISR